MRWPNTLTNTNSAAVIVLITRDVVESTAPSVVASAPSRSVMYGM